MLINDNVHDCTQHSFITSSDANQMTFNDAHY